VRIVCAQRPRIGDGWAIYNFLPERLLVNEQKTEIFILLLNSVFSAWNHSPIANKKLVKRMSDQLLPMRMLCVRAYLIINF